MLGLALWAATGCSDDDDDVVIVVPDAGVQVEDAATELQTLTTLCAESGGLVTESSCCSGTEAFPASCDIGACGCAPSDSSLIPTCDCGDGCFDRDQGCVKDSD